MAACLLKGTPPAIRYRTVAYDFKPLSTDLPDELFNVANLLTGIEQLFQAAGTVMRAFTRGLKRKFRPNRLGMSEPMSFIRLEPAESS